jgi:2-C-methyl-D-erythritol 4-phosphate cytidylyltransferase
MSAVDFWAAIPAAGVGTRMQNDVPKQYLQLSGRTVLEHSVTRLAAHPRIRGVALALSANDPYWLRYRFEVQRPLLITEGGAERCHSVLACLQALMVEAQADDWVLVHDAARPCVRRSDIDRLIDELSEDPVGGLLAVPVKETLKRADAEQRIADTVDRSSIWRAQTPQMFRLGALHKALTATVEAGRLVTDEAQAMEFAGFAPRLVEGHEDNIKITVPEDQWLAELYLNRQEEAACS